MNETWRSHDGNAGMCFPEESDLRGGQTDDRTPMNTDVRQQLVEFNKTLWTLVRRDGPRCDPGFMALAMETAAALSASKSPPGIQTITYRGSGSDLAKDVLALLDQVELKRFLECMPAFPVSGSDLERKLIEVLEAFIGCDEKFERWPDYWPVDEHGYCESCLGHGRTRRSFPKLKDHDPDCKFRSAYELLSAIRHLQQEG